MALGLDSFNIGLKKEGKWKVDKTKLIMLGIPSFIVSMTYVWALLGIRVGYMLNDYVILISNIILEHTLISSLYKD